MKNHQARITPEIEVEIMEMLNQGEYTLQQVGNKHGYTRENIRRIYIKNTGAGYKIRLGILKERKMAEKTEFMNQVKFICITCKTKVYNWESRHRNRFCNAKCLRDFFNIDFSKRVSCTNCQTSYHPKRATYYRKHKLKGSLGNFCGDNCYREYRKRVTWKRQNGKLVVYANL